VTLVFCLFILFNHPAGARKYTPCSPALSIAIGICPVIGIVGIDNLLHQRVPDYIPR